MFGLYGNNKNCLGNTMAHKSVGEERQSFRAWAILDSRWSFQNNKNLWKVLFPSLPFEKFSIQCAEDTDVVAASTLLKRFN